MARVAQAQNNEKRRRLSARYSQKRKQLKDIIMDKSSSAEDRFDAQLKLAKLPRNSSSVRIRNRCAITGRARGYYRRFGVSRIVLREWASFAMLPGVTKASW